MSFLASAGEGEEEEPICVDCGADSDDDSEVIVIDTTPTLLAEKMSADSDCSHDAKEDITSLTKKRRIEGTTENPLHKASLHTTTKDTEQNEQPSVQDDHQSVSETINEQELELNQYASIFEGCNSQEPIEIDDDSDDNNSDDENDENDCNIEDVKRTIDSSLNSVTSFTTSAEANPSMPLQKDPATYEEQRDFVQSLDNANQISSGKLTDEKRKENVATSSATGAACSREATILDASNSDNLDTGVATLNENVTQTIEADIVETANQSLETKEATRKRPIEVIDLADDDDDDDSIRQEQQEDNECNSTKISKSSQIQQPEIEIIDVDESEVSESEVRHDKLFPRQEELDKRNTTKPRFKPNKNSKPRKGEMFESLLRRHREDLRHRAMQNNAARSHRDGNEWHRTKSPSFSEKRFVFHPSNGKPRDHHENRFCGMDIEDARKEQERLFQQAANRVRNQPSFHVANDEPPMRSTKAAQAVTFSTVVADVHIQYPNHFKYHDVYARLGLPRNANESTIKSQYKRLARVYHPDRNIGKADTKHKFQAVTEAYNQLLQPSK